MTESVGSTNPFFVIIDECRNLSDGHNNLANSMTLSQQGHVRVCVMYMYNNNTFSAHLEEHCKQEYKSTLMTTTKSLYFEEEVGASDFCPLMTWENVVLKLLLLFELKELLIL